LASDVEARQGRLYNKGWGARIRVERDCLTSHRASDTHALVAPLDLAVWHVTLPSRTCGYLEGATSVALGRTAQDEFGSWMWDEAARTRKPIDYTVSTRDASSASTRLVVIP
jgi:hypothetical protein